MRSLACALLLLCAAAPALAQPPVIEIRPVPLELLEFRRWFTKYIDVFGIPVFAPDDTEDRDVLHGAGVLAQWLDNDEDGAVDNPKIIEALTDPSPEADPGNPGRASLIMFPTAQGEEADERIEEFFRNSPDGFNYETLQGDECVVARPMQCEPPRPCRHDGYDAAVEEVLHLVTRVGWSRVWPEIWGLCPEEDCGEFRQTGWEGSLVGTTMDALIGDCGFVRAITFSTWLSVSLT